MTYLKELAPVPHPLTPLPALPLIIYALDPAEVEREAVGVYALAGVEIISRQLENRTRHYRTRAGVLLTSLDEVCRAMESDDLLPVVELCPELAEGLEWAA